MNEVQLLVPVDPPSFPMVLANAAFLTTLVEVEAQVAAHKVTDAASAQEAALLQSRLTKAGKHLESARATLKAPILEIGRKIDEAARVPLQRIEASKNLLKGQLTSYDTELRRIAAETERARLAELARLEAIAAKEREDAAKKQAEIEEAARKAAAASKVQTIEIDDDDEPAAPPQKTATEKAIDAVKYAPAAVVERPTGIVYKTFLVAVIEDASKIPDQFVERVPKMAAIKSTFCTGYREGSPLPELAGVRFEVKRDAISRGNGGF